LQVRSQFALSGAGTNRPPAWRKENQQKRGNDDGINLHDQTFHVRLRRNPVRQLFGTTGSSRERLIARAQAKKRLDPEAQIAAFVLGL